MFALTLLPFLFLSVAATRCDISAATFDIPTASNQTAIVAPSHGPSYIGLAIGTQNYTCSNGTYSNVGAVAQLFDVSCLYDTPEFPKLQDIAYTVWKYAPPTAGISDVIAFLDPFHASFVLGQHYFVTAPSGTGLSPKWDFTSSGALAGHTDAFVVAAKVGDIPAPTGPPDVDWLSLKNVSGNLATQVFRLNTVGGLPPASCASGTPPITVKYASTYWFFGSSVQQ